MEFDSSDGEEETSKDGFRRVNYKYLSEVVTLL